MVEVKITWKDKNGKRHSEIYGECLAKNNTHAIRKAIEHCLDDYDRTGTLIEKDIVKVEVIAE